MQYLPLIQVALLPLLPEIDESAPYRYSICGQINHKGFEWIFLWFGQLLSWRVALYAMLPYNEWTMTIGHPRSTKLLLLLRYQLEKNMNWIWRQSSNEAMNVYNPTFMRVCVCMCVGLYMYVSREPNGWRVLYRVGVMLSHCMRTCCMWFSL